MEWDGKAGGFVGLEALQKRVQDTGRKAVDDKIVTFQVCAGGAQGLSAAREHGCCLSIVCTSGCCSISQAG